MAVCSALGLAGLAEPNRGDGVQGVELMSTLSGGRAEERAEAEKEPIGEGGAAVVLLGCDREICPLWAVRPTGSGVSTVATLAGLLGGSPEWSVEVQGAVMEEEMGRKECGGLGDRDSVGLPLRELSWDIL